MAELHALEDERQAVVDPELVQARQRLDAGFNSAMNSRLQSSGFGDVLQGIAENLEAQYSQIVQYQVDDMGILADNQSRRMTYHAGGMFQADIMHDLGLPEYVLEKWAI